MPGRAGGCWAGPENAAWQVHGAETRAMPALSCQAHAGDTAAALFASGASLVLVLPLDPPRTARRAKQAHPELADVLQQVRRVGAHSGDPGAMEAMETELHRAVLAAIANGAPDAQALAATALLTLKYGYDRRTR